jgi:hypothetical protein
MKSQNSSGSWNHKNRNNYHNYHHHNMPLPPYHKNHHPLPHPHLIAATVVVEREIRVFVFPVGDSLVLEIGR